MSIGRYSRRFMHLMAARWAAGQVGYEEIFLPMSCTAREGCRRDSFRSLLGSGLHFRFRPNWNCTTFLRSAMSVSRPLLWHPVKRRQCWADYLDACGGNSSRPGSCARLLQEVK